MGSGYQAAGVRWQIPQGTLPIRKNTERSVAADRVLTTEEIQHAHGDSPIVTITVPHRQNVRRVVAIQLLS